MLEDELYLLPWFLKPLVLTILIESVVAWICGVREWKFYKTMLFVNSLTNPLLNLFLLQIYRLQVGGVGGIILLCEIVVVLVEWRILRWIFPGQSRRMFLLSLAMNGTSYLSGLLIYRLL